MRKPIIWITTAAGAAALVAAGTAVAFAAGTLPVAASPTSTASPAPTASPAGDAPAPTASAFPSDIEAAIAAALAEVGAGTVLDADVDDDTAHAYEIDIRLEDGRIVEVALDRDLNVVRVEDETDSGRDDRSGDSLDDDAVPDAAAADAVAAAALAHVGSGTVVSVELSDDADHLYEVEIDLGDGEDIDVELDAEFTVVKAD